MTKTVYPRDDDNVYSERCPNIRIGFTRNLYRELQAKDRRRPEEQHKLSIYMADVGALIHTLPQAYRTLLFHIDAKVVLNYDHRFLARCAFKRRRIRINAEYVTDFRFEKRVVTGSARQARHAHSLLFEETSHYLFSALRFYQTPGYRAAMRREIEGLSRLQRGIMRLERAYNSTIRGGKRAFSRIAPDEQPEELLIDLLHIKNYLAAQDYSARDIDAFMRAAFPHSWPFARAFEKRVADEARKLTRRAHRPVQRPFRPNGPDHGQLPDLRRLVKRTLQQAAA